MTARVALFGCLALLSSSFATGAEPTKARNKTPPWQRLLQGKDAERAEELNKRIKAAEQHERFSEAIKLHKEFLVLRTKAQGADHWEATDEKWQLDAARKLAALSADKRAAWREGQQGAADAQKLEAKGRYAEAEPLWQEYRRGCEAAFGKKHPTTVTIYNALAANLEAQGKYSEAEALFQQALELSRGLLGEKHPSTLAICNNLAFTLNAQGKYAAAQPLYQEALDVRREVLGEKHPDTAVSYSELAGNLAAQQKYDQAQPLYERALELRRALLGDKHLETALSYSNLAYNLNAQAKYREAQPLFEKALELYQELVGEKNPSTATTYHNLAYTLSARGNYREAESLYEKALELRLELLGEKHAETATTRNGLAANLHSQGKYSEAQSLYQKALDVRREVLGEKHSDTADSYNNLAYNWNAQGRYAEAQPLFQKALDLRLELVGEKNQATAISYQNLAFNLHSQGKYDEAQPLYRKALDLHLELFGEKHPTTATIYSNVALNLDAQEKHGEAEPLYHKALELSIELLGEKHPSVARSYSNLAANLDEQGKYDEAEPLYQKALDLRLEVLGEKHPDTVSSYNNLAYNLNVRGKYGVAEPLFQKALALSLELLGEKHPRVALSYINLASNLDRQGKYAEAQPLYQKALDLSLEALGEKHPQTAMCYNKLAGNLYAQVKYPEALELYRTALELLGEKHPDTAETYSNLAIILHAQRKYADAEPLLQKALQLRLDRLGEKHPDTAFSYTSLAGNLDAQGKYAEAVPLYEKALELQRELLGENHPNTVLGYKNLALNLHLQAKHADARRALVKAAASYEAARLSVAERGLDRAVFGGERSPYPLLAAAQARLGEGEAAWLAAETDLARGLSDETASRRGVALSPEEQVRRDARANRLSQIAQLVLALVSKRSPTDDERTSLRELLDERRALEAEAAELAVVLSKRELAPLADIQAALADDAALVMWIEVRGHHQKQQEHWGCIVRRSGKPIWEELPAGDWVGRSGEDEAVVRWRFGRGVAIGSALEDIAELANTLFARRIAPLKKHLVGVKRLIVVPVGEMAGVPVNVLSDSYIVSYVPSGTLLARLKSRPPANGNSFLALGDPWPLPTEPTEEPPRSAGGLLIWQVFPGGSAAKAGLLPGDRLLKYGGAVLSSQEQLAKLIREHGPRESVEVTTSRAGKIANVELQPSNLGMAFNYADPMRTSATTAAGWTELPATAVEVRRLAALAGDEHSLVFTRSAASERELERLRASGKLAQFRYLHFATHGESNDAQAFESALILSPDRISKEVPNGGRNSYDGRLTANEVLRNWELNADLVTLSACESALGRRGGGDGVLGFAQAFLLAGARSVCLSLWKVDDTATALLMERFYQNLLGKRAGLSQPMPKAEALAEAKNWLRELTLDKATKLAADMTSGFARGKSEPALKLVVPAAGKAVKAKHPFAHPRYWAAFILIGDPD